MPPARARQNLYSEENLAKNTEGGKWNTKNGRDREKEEKEVINVKNRNYGPMESDPGPGSSGMENDIRPILETDFSYTYSPIVHGPKWYPTMVRLHGGWWCSGLIFAIFS